MRDGSADRSIRHRSRRARAPVVGYIVDPRAVHVETADTDWIVTGLRPDRVARTIDVKTRFDDVIQCIRRQPGEFTVVAVDDDTVRAFRGLTSTYDVFLTRRPSDDAIVVGDHFGKVLAELPLQARTVPEGTGVDHLLFGCRPNDTYVEEVDRLGHGQRIVWPRRGDPEISLVDTLSDSDRIEPSRAISRLDGYLDDATAFEDEGSVGTMLSGGVDSVLLHTYLATDESTNAVIDSPEFAFEDEYARKASELLGSDHTRIAMTEANYLDHLEATVDATAHPLLLPQGALLNLAFRESQHDVLVNGGLADGVFGTGIAALAYLARFLGPGGRFVPPVTDELDTIATTATAIRKSATDVDGTAMGFRIHADEETVASMYGREAIDDRKQRRFHYTQRRLPTTQQQGYGGHMHLGHCIEYFHDVILSNWRQGALASGTSLLTPFAGREVLETALAVPPTRRYARWTVPDRSRPSRVVAYKYLVKDLLSQRLPAYDTNKPKGHGMLPFRRYLADGPLSNVFEEYAVPEFVPSEHRPAVREGTSEISWYAANFAIWRDRVLRNDNLCGPDPAVVLER